MSDAMNGTLLACSNVLSYNAGKESQLAGKTWHPGPVLPNYSLNFEKNKYLWPS